MSQQVLNQFRSDKALRDDCVAIYEALGMDLNTAFRMFMVRTCMVGDLPFPAILPEKPLDEINAETRRTIENARKGIGLSRGFSSVAELMEDLNADD